MLRRFVAARVSSQVFRALATLTVMLIGSLSAWATITTDATSVQTGGGSTTMTFSHTLGTGGNRLVVCTVAVSDPGASVAISTITPTVTFGGQPMTGVAISPSSSTKVLTEIFWANDTVLSGLSGAQTVSVTLPTAPTGLVAGCSSWFGVAQAGPETSNTYYNGSGTWAAVTLSGLNVGDLVVDSFAGGFTASANPSKSATPNSPLTQLYDTQLSTDAVLGASSYELATASSASLNWTDMISRLAYGAIAFAAAPTTNYTITTAASPAGSGTFTFNPTGSSFPAGSSVQVTANPAIGYTFSNFTGDLTGATNPQTLVVNGNKSITGVFTATPCTLTINVVGQGTVTPVSGSSYTCGTQVTVTATPANGYSFGSYSGALTGSTNPQTLTLNTNSTVTATFVQGSSCTLSTGVTGSGSITVNPSGTVFTCGTQLTITAVPATYYSFTGFSGSLSGTTNPQTYVINSNSTISAAFTQTNFPINTTISGPGTVSANPADSGNGYASGTQVTLTATPNSGAFFTGFSGDLTGTTNPQTLTVNATKNVTASFSNATITEDAVSHAASAGSASTLSWMHTLGSGNSRAVIIAVGEADSVASPDQYAVVTSVTFNGVYATPVPNSVVYGGTSGMVQAQLFYLLEPELPAAGTYTIQVNLAGSIAGISAGAVSLIGVSEGPPEAVVTNKNTSGADLLSTSITTLTNNAWVVDILEDGDIAVLTANSGQTLAWQTEAKLGTGGSSTKAVATAGANTVGWSGSANRLVQSLAAFPPATATIPATHTLTTSVAGGVGGTISTNPGLSTYPLSTGVLLTATPQTGYSFSGWTGDYTSTTNPLPITMDSDRNIVANFTAAQTCTLALSVTGSGSVTVNGATNAGIYNCNAVLTLQATPGSGYTFNTFGGALSSTNNPSYFTITANSTITAEFDPVPTCTLNITTVGSGSVTPAPGSYTCGTVLTLQATAGGGYAFSGYSGDISTTSNPTSLTLNQNTNVTATFTQGSGCSLTTSVTGQGTITPSSGTWSCGTVIPIQAQAASHYLFNGWGGALSGSTTPTTLTMSSNETVSATFVVNVAGVTGDTRTVTQPVYPPVCTVLTAVQSVSAPVETSPDTTRVQAALNACSVGQAVEFSANGSANAFIIQPITLPAGVTMLVDPEVTILASIKYADYACNTSEGWCNPVINIAPNTYPATGSAIMGLGVIDGRGGTTLTDKGESWWKTGQDARPRLVYLSSHTTGASSDNFTAYQITLKNSPKFHLSGVGNDWTVWGIKVYAPPDSPNTDGIDPSGSSNVTITNSYISDGDDWVSPKADSGHIANVTVSNLYTYSGHGISIGSETNAGLNNMYVHDIVIDNGFGGTSFDSLRIKSGASEGGEVYDVLYKNICINNGGDTIVIDPYYTSASGTLYPNFHDITFSNVTKLLHNSSYKSTMTGYNTNGVVYPLTVTLDNVDFVGDSTNDFKAPDNFNNVQFTFGPGPVSMATYLTADAAVASNYITVTNSITNPNEAAYSCTGVFKYLSGDLTAPSATVTAGTSPNITAVLQNVVSPVQAGTISYPQQNAPTGTVTLMEGTNTVGTVPMTGRLTYISIPSITAGTHTYTAVYNGDSHFSAMNFGSFTLTAINPAPVAVNQSVTVSYNTATPITLTATGSGTLTYSVVAQPTHGTLSGTAPNLTYTPTANYGGADSFTFKANNGTDSNVATVTITVQSGAGSQSQTITFPAPGSPVTYGASAITLGATASSNLPVTYSITGPASLSGNSLSFTAAGSIVVTASQAGNGTYAPATPVSQMITVNDATLTVAVSGTPSRYYGAPNPAFSYTIGTFVNSDTQASATTGAPSLTTTAVPRSSAGTYPITVSQGTLTASNYNFNFSNGQLTVLGGAAQMIVFPPLPNFTHGTSVVVLAASTSGLPVTLTVTSGPASITNNVLSITGTGTVQITATQLGSSNFGAAASVVRTFTAQ